MKRNIRKTAILLSAVILGEILCLQGNSDITGTQTGILAGTGSRIVHGAELFADGTERTGAEQSADTDEPEITVAPVPTDVPEPGVSPSPEPSVTPEPSVIPDPTPGPGMSMNIENLNIYTNGQEDLFGDGSVPEDTGGDVSGGYSGGGEMSAEQKEELIRQPRLLLESFNLTEKALNAGDQADMELVFKNRSSSQGIYNLKVSFSTESPSIQFEKKSFYFSGVNPGADITINSKVSITKDAKDGPVPVTVSFEYEDVKGKAATGTESIEIRVAQPVTAVLDCEGIPATVYSTDTIDLAVRVQNLSRTGIYNVRVDLEGQGMFPKEEIFVGNMDAGTMSEGTMSIYVGTRTMKAAGQDEGTDESEMYGKVSGKLTLSYEDLQGNIYQETSEYQTQINKPEIQSLKIETPKKANSWWYSVFVVAGAGMLLIIIGLVIRNRRQKMLLEEARREAAGEHK